MDLGIVLTFLLGFFQVHFGHGQFRTFSRVGNGNGYFPRYAGPSTNLQIDRQFRKNKNGKNKHGSSENNAPNNRRNNIEDGGRRGYRGQNRQVFDFQQPNQQFRGQNNNNGFVPSYTRNGYNNGNSFNGYIETQIPRPVTGQQNSGEVTQSTNGQVSSTNTRYGNNRGNSYNRYIETQIPRQGFGNFGRPNIGHIIEPINRNWHWQNTGNRIPWQTSNFQDYGQGQSQGLGNMFNDGFTNQQRYGGVTNGYSSSIITGNSMFSPPMNEASYHADTNTQISNQQVDINESNNNIQNQPKTALENPSVAPQSPDFLGSNNGPLLSHLLQRGLVGDFGDGDGILNDILDNDFMDVDDRFGFDGDRIDDVFDNDIIDDGVDDVLDSADDLVDKVDDTVGDVVDDVLENDVIDDVIDRDGVGDLLDRDGLGDGLLDDGIYDGIDDVFDPDFGDRFDGIYK